MRKVIVFIGLLTLLFGGKAFALFPTDEMLKDPLFDSLFVLHNDEERRVDDSLFEYYNKLHPTGEEYQTSVDKDPRFPYSIRKVLEVDKTIHKELNKFDVNPFSNTGVFTRKYSSVTEESRDYMSNLFKQEPNINNLREEFVKSQMDSIMRCGVKSNPIYATTPLYRRVTRGVDKKSKYIYIFQPYDLKAYLSAKFYISFLNKTNRDNLVFYFSSFGDMSFQVGALFNNMPTNITHKGSIKWGWEEYSVRETELNGSIDYAYQTIEKCEISDSAFFAAYEEYTYLRQSNYRKYSAFVLQKPYKALWIGKNWRNKSDNWLPYEYYESIIMLKRKSLKSNVEGNYQIFKLGLKYEKSIEKLSVVHLTKLDMFTMEYPVIYCVYKSMEKSEEL